MANYCKGSTVQCSRNMMVVLWIFQIVDLLQGELLAVYRSPESCLTIGVVQFQAVNCLFITM